MQVSRSNNPSSSAREEFRMTWAGNFYRSAIGKKAVMAVTGAILFGWIFLHKAGNMKLYFGPEHFNDYAKWIRTIGTPLVPDEAALWISRLILLVAVVFHIHAATALTLKSRRARPISYRERDDVTATYATRTMRWGGVIILLFVIYNILQLTTGTLHQSFVENDAYHKLVAGFQLWWGGFGLHHRQPRPRPSPRRSRSSSRSATYRSRFQCFWAG
jgi:succinate dehydrogenase / fumarate reductase cytochrome b subunit